MTVDEQQAHLAGHVTCPVQAAEQDRAVTADDERAGTAAQALGDSAPHRLRVVRRLSIARSRDPFRSKQVDIHVADVEEPRRRCSTRLPQSGDEPGDAQRLRCPGHPVGTAGGVEVDADDSHGIIIRRP